MADSPTFIGIRQRDFTGEISCEIELTGSVEVGITLYMDENHHYDLAVRASQNGGCEVIERLNIGDVKAVQRAVPISDSNAKLMIRANNFCYTFYVSVGGEELQLGSGQTRYLSSEVACGFTGVVIGLYAVGDWSVGEFRNFVCEYK